jgi:hypothetical protein
MTVDTFIVYVGVYPSGVIGIDQIGLAWRSRTRS